MRREKRRDRRFSVALGEQLRSRIASRDIERLAVIVIAVSSRGHAQRARLNSFSASSFLPARKFALRNRRGNSTGESMRSRSKGLKLRKGLLRDNRERRSRGSESREGRREERQIPISKLRNLNTGLSPPPSPPSREVTFALRCPARSLRS